MPKLSKLKKRADFVNIAKKGKSVVTSGLVLQTLKNDLDETRIGYTATKKIGNAIIRNRSKRRMRALVKECEHIFKTSQDYVLLARKSTLTREFTKLKKDLIFAIHNV